MRFAQMLLGEGELGGVRLLQPETVRLMRRNHLPDDLIPIGPRWPDHGFGLGFVVALGENPGTYWWVGAANTYFWIDPNEELIALAWTQFRPFGGAALDRVLKPIVYEALR
jgi:CubicO group peptidase (beta-lactamase class C family)